MLSLCFLFVFGLFCCCVFCFTPTIESYSFASAQCKARCLSKYAYSSGIVKLSNIKALKCKRNDMNCRECVQLCYNPTVTIMKKDCETVCSNEAHQSYYGACKDSCIFISNTIELGWKSGSCQKHLDQHFQMVEKCKIDWECPVDEKCCMDKNGKHSCHAPKLTISKTVPINLRITNIQANSCTLVWEKEPEFQHEVMQFVIEKRYSSKSRSEDHLSFWEYAGQCSRLHRNFPDLHVGGWYQFRISAVTKHGHIGYSQPSPIVKLPFNHTRPSKPKDLQIKGTFKGGDMKFTVYWKPPERSAGIIKKYRVIYFQSIPTSSFTIISRDFVQNVPPGKQHATLDNLKRYTKYEVRVFAVAEVASIRMRGEQATLTFITKPEITPSPSQLLSTNRLMETKKKDICHDQINHTALSINGSINLTPLYNKSARINWTVIDPNVNVLEVIWKSDDCRNVRTRRRFLPSRLNQFQIPSLQKNCIYSVQVQPYLYYGVKGKKICFTIDTRHSTSSPNNTTVPDDIILSKPYLASNSCKHSIHSGYYKQYILLLFIVFIVHLYQ